MAERREERGGKRDMEGGRAKRVREGSGWNIHTIITAFLYTAGRLFKYDVICSQVAGYNSNKQNDPIDDALCGRHALASQRESEPLACLKFESKQRVIFPLATVAMAYWEHAEYKLLL